MTSRFVKSIIISSIFTTAGAYAQGGQVYPFQYFESLPTSFDPGSSRVYPGVIASINSAELSVNPTNVLYVAPKKAKVAVTAFAANEFAGCQEVRNDSVVSDELSAIFKTTVDTLRVDSEFVLELATEETKAKRACKDAIISRSSQKDELCKISRDLSELRAQSSEDLTPTLTKLNTIRDTVATRLDTYGNQLGGTAGAVVELWDKAEIEEVRSLNPGKVVQVVPLKNVTFNFEAGVEKNSALGDIVPRRTALGFSLQGQTLKAGATGGTPEAVTQVKTGESTSLGIMLSRLGACSRQDAIRFGTFAYDYDTYGYIRGEASYNRHDFFKRVKSSSTKNGFFTTKTSRKVTEDMLQSETLKIAAMGDDLVSQAEMRERLLASVEKRIVDQMANRATKDVGSAPESGELVAPTPGAETAGDALLKCPDWRCQVGGYVLKTAAAIWGEGNTEDSFERNWNYTVTEKWSETTLHQANGSSSAQIKF